MKPDDYYVYILHFEPALGRFRHYCGSTVTTNLRHRMADHAAGRGAALTRRAVLAGCQLHLVSIEPAESRARERRVKRAGSLKERCYLCNPRLAKPELARAITIPARLLSPPAWTSYGSSPGSSSSSSA